MCQQLDAIDALTAAANALTRACHCRIEAISISLHHAFDVTLGEPLPAELAALAGLADAAIA